MTAPTLAAIRREMADDLAACAAALRGTDPLYQVRVRVHRVYLRLLDIDYLTEGAGAPLSRERGVVHSDRHNAGGTRAPQDQP